MEDNRIIIKDDYGSNIYEGDRFNFKFRDNTDTIVEFEGSFCWNQDELRYEIDIYEQPDYVCLYYMSDRMFEFVKI